MLPEHIFDEPLFLITLVLPAWLALRAWRRGCQPLFAFSFMGLLETPHTTMRERLRHLPWFLRWITLSLIGVALAGPAVSQTSERVVRGGLDIMLLVDASRSMLAEDLDPNRFEAAKRLAERLVRARPDDRFGLMVFAARSTIQCPLMSDHEAFRARLRRVSLFDREEGTALGAALVDALRYLKSTARGPRAIVVLSDGASNAGEITPETGTAIAAAMDVRVYAVGLGGREPARYPSEFGFVEVTLSLDEAVLQRLASTTDGVYIPPDAATEADRLSAELDRIEAPVGLTTVETSWASAADRYLFVALIFLLVELLLRAGYLRAFP